MAERIGSNGRKKRALRAKRRRFAVARTVVAVMVALLVSGGGMMLYEKFGARASYFAARVDAWRHPTINRVVVEGTLLVGPDELLRRGGTVLPITLKGLKRVFREKTGSVNPWIEMVRRVRVRGGTATITVIERQPVALLQRGTICLVDRHGVCIPLERGVAHDVPLVSGLSDSTGLDGIRLLTQRDRVRLVCFLHETSLFDTAFARAMAQLHFKGDGTVGITVTGTPTVVTIREDAVREGLGRLARIWPIVGNDPQQPRSIDLSYRNIAFVTTRGAARMAGAKDLETPKDRG
jgi:hypothetical protein